MRAYLHSHSSASDGTRPPAEVVRRAAAASLDAIALTDHDTVAGIGAAASALPAGLILVPGMELSCRRDGHSVHLLAYLFDPDHPELAAQTQAIRDSRIDRAREMVAKLAELGTGVTWEHRLPVFGGRKFRDLSFRSARGGNRDQLRLAFFHAQERDTRAIRRPSGPFVMSSGRMGQVACRTLFHRNGKNIAACAEYNALALRA